MAFLYSRQVQVSLESQFSGVNVENTVILLDEIARCHRRGRPRTCSISSATEENVLLRHASRANRCKPLIQDLCLPCGAPGKLPINQQWRRPCAASFRTIEILQIWTTANHGQSCRTAIAHGKSPLDLSAFL